MLIPISLPASGGPLANDGALLAPPPPLDAGRRIIALHLQRLADRDPYSAAPVRSAESQRSEALEPLLNAAKRRWIFPSSRSRS